MLKEYRLMEEKYGDGKLNLKEKNKARKSLFERFSWTFKMQARAKGTTKMLYGMEPRDKAMWPMRMLELSSFQLKLVSQFRRGTFPSINTDYSLISFSQFPKYLKEVISGTKRDSYDEQETVKRAFEIRNTIQQRQKEKNSRSKKIVIPKKAPPSSSSSSTTSTTTATATATATTARQLPASWLQHSQHRASSNSNSNKTQNITSSYQPHQQQQQQQQQQHPLSTQPPPSPTNPKSPYAHFGCYNDPNNVFQVDYTLEEITA
ncbi:hypothetical protein ScalyP_jg80, partial [Parmales sp. scaly parma]